MILPGASESGIDCHALWTVSLGPALVLAALWFPISIPDFGCTRVAGAASSQPAVFPRAKAGHEAC